MGQGLSNQDGRAWENDIVALRDRVDRRPNRALSSGLNDVIHWLDSAELSEQVLGDGVRLCASNFDLQQPDSHQSLEFDATYSSKSIDRDKVVSSQLTDHISRKLEQGMCCRGPARLGNAKDVKMLTMGTSQEETEWEERQKTTGAAARLVAYENGEAPQDDFTLRGGEGQRIVVAVVREEGPAFACGVRAGDLLASIDGKKDFIGKSADDVHASLLAPVVLVFIGFVGKLAAEVRLGSRGGTKVGIPVDREFVCRPDHRVSVADEIVFQASGPLFLATPRWAVSQPSVASGNVVDKSIDSVVDANGDDTLAKGLLGNDEIVGSQASSDPMASSSHCHASEGHGLHRLADDLQPTVFYELRGSDARHLIRRALGHEMNPADLDRSMSRLGSRASTGLTPRGACIDSAVDADDDDALRAMALRDKSVHSQTLPWQLTPTADTTFRMGPSITTFNDRNGILGEKLDNSNFLTKPVQLDGDSGLDNHDVMGPSKTAPRGCDNLQTNPWKAIGASPVNSPATSSESSPREA